MPDVFDEPQATPPDDKGGDTHVDLPAAPPSPAAVDAIEAVAKIVNDSKDKARANEQLTGELAAAKAATAAAEAAKAPVPDGEVQAANDAFFRRITELCQR